MITYKKERIYFSTFTIDRWMPLLSDYPSCSDIIIDILNFMSSQWDTKIFAFCIMKDHVHIVWELGEYEISDIEHSFKSFSSNQFTKYFKDNEPLVFLNFSSERKDRKVKFWKLKSCSIQLKKKVMVFQKIKYVHDNPTKDDYYLVDKSQDYKYSSARNYMRGKDGFDFVAQFTG